MFPERLLAAEPRQEARTSTESSRLLRRARSACIAFSSFSQPGFVENLRSTDMRRHDDPIVHPLSLAPSRNDPRTTQIGQVPGNFGLRARQNLHKIADTHFLVAHKVQEAQPGFVAERLKEPFDVEGLVSLHVPCIRLDEYESNSYSRLSTYEEGYVKAAFGVGEIKIWGGRGKHLSNDHAGVQAVAEAFGYTAEELTSIPADANMGLSCGNPTATAHLRAGEVVVDLGSGGGLDVFLAQKW